ncbi:ornithine decarboxylase-like [Sphaeramia orbicularis]|uniref:ornithine decarboxylase-like n=1 Tax=Sphaeramia orbicularis TaxID=375764 RepID=UPI00118108A3|nr:ornithine decarboxylase-like [Sphaeramia orbicularis]
MEKDTAPASTNTSVMDVLFTEKCDIEILDATKSISDFMDDKIKERHSVDSEVPFFVANLDDLFQKHIRWLRNLPRVKPFYAVKCNSTPAVIRVLRILGTGFDCASKGEIELALSLGATPDQIIYAHTTKPQSHIKYACTRGVDMMTFDSEEELLKVSACHTKAKLVLRISVDDSKSAVRLNQKFGAKLSKVEKLLERCKELDLEVMGVSFHVGSGCTDSSAYRQAIEDARHVFDTAILLGFQMRLLDIGGGFPGNEDFHIQFDEFSEVISEALDEFFPADSGVQVIAEPGRYYVESAFTLAVNVFAKKVVMDDVTEIRGADSDTVMMYYISDGVYGSINCLLNDPAHTNVAPYLHRVVDSSERRYQSIIWGPTCDSLDRVTDTYWMPEVHVGDWLLIDNMGAYSVSVSSDFNGFDKAHVYPVLSAHTWNMNVSHS